VGNCRRPVGWRSLRTHRRAAAAIENQGARSSVSSLPATRKPNPGLSASTWPQTGLVFNFLGRDLHYGAPITLVGRFFGASRHLRLRQTCESANDYRPLPDRHSETCDGIGHFLIWTGRNNAGLRRWHDLSNLPRTESAQLLNHVPVRQPRENPLYR
jgi:hypothetical protein